MLEWIVCFVFGCVIPSPAAEPIPPDVSKIISVVGTGSVAHACPVTADLALTAGHVVRSQSLPSSPGGCPRYVDRRPGWTDRVLLQPRRLHMRALLARTRGEEQVSAPFWFTLTTSGLLLLIAVSLVPDPAIRAAAVSYWAAAIAVVGTIDIFRNGSGRPKNP